MDTNDSIFSDIHPTERDASFAQGFFTRLIDFAFEMAILILLYLFIPRAIMANLSDIGSFVKFLIIIVIIFIYQFVFLLLFNKTIGMMFCRVKLLNKELKPLSSTEKALSIFRTRFSSIKYYQDN